VFSVFEDFEFVRDSHAGKFLNTENTEGTEEGGRRHDNLYDLSFLARFETQISARSSLSISPLLFARFHKQRRDGNRLAGFIQGHKSEKSRRGMFARSGNGIFREDVNSYFYRRMERTIDLRFEDNQVSYTHGIQKIEVIHRRCNHLAMAVPVRGDGTRDVDQVHHSSAQNIS